jgi:hypothetical protein
VTADTKEDIYNSFAAYVRTVPLEELIESVARARRDAQLRHVRLKLRPKKKKRE